MIATCAFTSLLASSLLKIGAMLVLLSPVLACVSPAMPEMPAVVVELADPLSDPIPTPLGATLPPPIATPKPTLLAL